MEPRYTFTWQALVNYSLEVLPAKCNLTQSKGQWEIKLWGQESFLKSISYAQMCRAS